jgi:hypothetical protein
MGNHSSGVVRRDVVPQPTLALGFVGGCGIVPLVASGIGNGITENLVNYMSRRLGGLAHNPPLV